MKRSFTTIDGFDRENTSKYMYETINRYMYILISGKYTVGVPETLQTAVKDRVHYKKKCHSVS